jgi:hypothetical protein
MSGPRKFSSIYYLKFIPIVFQLIMLITLSVKGADLSEAFLHWYWPVFLMLSALFFLLQLPELKNNRWHFIVNILLASASVVIALFYLFRI